MDYQCVNRREMNPGERWQHLRAVIESAGHSWRLCSVICLDGVGVVMDGHQMKGLEGRWIYFSFLLEEVADKSYCLINASLHGDGGLFRAPV